MATGLGRRRGRKQREPEQGREAGAAKQPEGSHPSTIDRPDQAEESPSGEPSLPLMRPVSCRPFAARNATDRSGSAGSARLSRYERYRVTPKDAVIAAHVRPGRSANRRAAARNTVKNTKSLAPICATDSVPSGWKASVNAFSTCSWCSTITFVGPAATL